MPIQLRNAVAVVVLSTVSGCGGGETAGPDTSGESPLRRSVSVTVFRIGEEGSEENGSIPNISSAWEDHWEAHDGGTDDPNDRNGYSPAASTPSENPFCFALPYNEFDDAGERKTSALDIVYWAKEKEWGARESMCKNRWVTIVQGEKVACAQWEDVGPFGEDDAAYVLGSAPHVNHICDSDPHEFPVSDVKGKGESPDKP